MNISPDLHHALVKINSALLKGDNAALAQAFDGADLQRLLSQETITFARALGKSPLVILLCTLAQHNDVEVERAKHWLACYQAIANQQLETHLARVSGQQVLRLAVRALTLRQPLEVDQLRKIKPKGLHQDWLDATEILLDHKYFSSLLALLSHLGHKPSEEKTWIQIARSLSQRHRLYVDETGLPSVDVDYQILAKIYDMCADAARQAKIPKVQQALLRLSASALEISGDYHQALNRLMKINYGESAFDVQIDIARCYCKSGNMLNSINSLDHALSILVKKSSGGEILKSESLQSAKIEPPNSENSFDPRKASRALSDLTKMANEKNTPIFLVSGTLLGYVRNGQLLSHDKDIDVGIVGWANQYALCMALQESGLFTLSSQFLKGHETLCIPIKHNATGIWIDVFVYHERENKWVTGVDFFFGYRQEFEFTPFELEDIEFLDVVMKAPADSEKNLTENYGNWRIPDATYLSHLESPSTIGKGNLAYMLTARLLAISACNKRQSSKLNKILTLMQKYKNMEGAMSEDLMSALTNSFLSEPINVKEKCHA